MSDQASKKRNLAVVAIIMNNNGQVLLTRRHQPKSQHTHGKWQFAGGGIDHGEHPQEALIREISEEVGLIDVDVLSDTPFLFSNVHQEIETHTIVLGFPVKYLSGEVDTSKDEETGDAGWFTIEEIRTLESLPGTVEFVERALTYISNYPASTGYTRE